MIDYRYPYKDGVTNNSEVGGLKSKKWSILNDELFFSFLNSVFGMDTCHALKPTAKKVPIARIILTQMCGQQY